MCERAFLAQHGMANKILSRKSMILLNAPDASKAPHGAAPIQTHLYPPDKLNLGLSEQKINKIVERLGGLSVGIHGSYITARFDKGYQRATLMQEVAISKLCDAEFYVFHALEDGDWLWL